MSATEKPDRLRTLLETGIAISSELSLDAVLQRIVDAAALVTEAGFDGLASTMRELAPLPAPPRGKG